MRYLAVAIDCGSHTTYGDTAVNEFYKKGDAKKLSSPYVFIICAAARGSTNIIPKAFSSSGP